METATRVGALILCLGWCSALGCQDPAKLVNFPFPVERIELRPAETERGDGLEETVTSVTGQKLFLHPREKGLIGAEDLSKAYVVIHPDKGIEVILCTEFKESGQKKMEQLNQTHRNKPVVVMIDGKARRPSDPRMRQASNTELAIAGVFTREEAQQLSKEARK
jgi:preprotein translocase subunit SecD